MDVLVQCEEKKIGGRIIMRHRMTGDEIAQVEDRQVSEAIYTLIKMTDGRFFSCLEYVCDGDGPLFSGVERKTCISADLEECFRVFPNNDFLRYFRNDCMFSLTRSRGRSDDR